MVAARRRSSGVSRSSAWPGCPSHGGGWVRPAGDDVAGNGRIACVAVAHEHAGRTKGRSMARFSDPQTLRRWTAGCCLLGAPVLYVAVLVADPAIRDGGDAVGVYGAFPGQVAVSASLLHWGWVLLIPGIIGMVHLVRDRAVLRAARPAAARTGTGLGAQGAVVGAGRDARRHPGRSLLSLRHDRGRPALPRGRRRDRAAHAEDERGRVGRAERSVRFVLNAEPGQMASLSGFRGCELGRHIGS